MLPKETFLLQLGVCPPRKGDSCSISKGSVGDSLRARDEMANSAGVDNHSGLGSGASAVALDAGLAAIGSFVGALSVEAGVAAPAGA
jgi:hypothetical protein